GSGPGTGSGSVPASASGAGSVAAQDRELVGRPPAVVDEDTPGWERSAAWYAVGIAIALGTSAAVFGLSAASREEDVHNLINFRDTNGRPLPFTGATRDRYRDLVDEGPRLEKLSMIALAATGAAAAASAVFFVLDSRRDRPGRRRAPSSSVGAAIAPGTASLRWSGSF
ncbi:MAG TPA: hypothetical protein VEL05_02695, partial [Candidatus Acidoferrum sp.]|nr:hypothetical protein [Candidatus Acidoferrum sp.]